jgi:hypothetical protein
MKSISFPLQEKLLRLPVPGVGGIRVRMDGKIPLLRNTPPPTEAYDELLDLDPVPEMTAPTEEDTPEVKPAEKVTREVREVVVRVLATPKKRGPRVPKVEPAPAPPPEPKPLKVIRRRREEEPKVFETFARAYGDPMFRGFKAKSAGDEES